MYVEEANRSWCTSNRSNDQRAITIECASDITPPYTMNDAVYATLIELCTDICKRNGKTKLLWFADKEKTLAYAPAADEMLITVHRWFANKSCPGDWLYSRLADLAAKVTAALNPAADEEEAYPEKLTSGYYRVRKTWKDSKSQIGAYRNLKNAKAAADKNPGTFVFTDDGKAIYPVETYRIHTVVEGDSLWEIAKKYLGDGSRYPEIKTLNGLTSNVIYSGWKLKIPN